MASKRDINGFRTPDDVVRRYKLEDIELNSEDIEKIKQEIICDDQLSISSTAPVQNKVITEALNNKVNRVAGKGLSTNDFTDTYKEELEAAYSNMHTHSNKSVLDGITSTDITNWNNKSDFKATTLFDDSNGVIGDVTFTNPITNQMSYIDIFYANASGNYNTTRVYNPIGKTTYLQVGSCSATTYANRTQAYTIAANGLTAGTCHKYTINSAGTVTSTTNASVTDADKLLVYKVIGYRT